MSIKSKKITLAMHLYDLQHCQLIRNISVKIQANKLICRGTLSPYGHKGLQYNFRLIQDSCKCLPVVWVTIPNLAAIIKEKEGLPHFFDFNIKKSEIHVCLCQPYEYTRTKHFSHTIIPWLIEWLLWFDIWRATGMWRGGGHEPHVKKINLD